MIFRDMLENKVLITAVACWFFAQLIKVIIDFLLEGQFNFERFHGSGGMPSSHSSTICGLTCAVGYSEGFQSSLFALSFIMAVIVMHDASNVRRSVGDHARLLNQQFNAHLLSDNQKLFKELIGHKPLEVIVGAALGVIISTVFYYAVW